MNSSSDNDPILPTLGLERNLRARTRKIDVVDDLLRALDTLIFLQIAIIYYSDNLTFILLLRSISQVLYVQVRPPPFTSVTQLPPVVFANFACIITHAVHARPEATSRVTRGYLFGGLIVDFVGELGPISKWRLIGLDIFILGLQLLMLAVAYEKMKINGETSEKETVHQQDVEAEEAGIRRGREATETEEGIELQNLSNDNVEEGTKDRPINVEETGDTLLELDVRGNLRALIKRHFARNASSTSTSTSNANSTIGNLLDRVAANRIPSATSDY